MCVPFIYVINMHAWGKSYRCAPFSPSWMRYCPPYTFIIMYAYHTVWCIYGKKTCLIHGWRIHSWMYKRSAWDRNYRRRLSKPVWGSISPKGIYNWELHIYSMKQSTYIRTSLDWFIPLCISLDLVSADLYLINQVSGSNPGGSNTAAALSQPVGLEILLRFNFPPYINLPHMWDIV